MRKRKTARQTLRQIIKRRGKKNRKKEKKKKKKERKKERKEEREIGRREVDKGRKYYRVWCIDNQKMIHCFVNIKTGDVFKPESYNKPAKHVRYNLLDKQSRQSMFEKAHYAGGYLYLK